MVSYLNHLKTSFRILGLPACIADGLCSFRIILPDDFLPVGAALAESAVSLRLWLLCSLSIVLAAIAKPAVCTEPPRIIFSVKVPLSYPMRNANWGDYLISYVTSELAQGGILSATSFTIHFTIHVFLHEIFPLCPLKKTETEDSCFSQLKKAVGGFTRQKENELL